MKRAPNSAWAKQAGPLECLFTAMFGVLLGLALVKFGNPPSMERWVTAPTNIYEFVLGSPWPITWAYGLLAAVALLGLAIAKWDVRAPLWLLVLPLAWLVWECVAAAWTVNPEPTKATLAHF